MDRLMEDKKWAANVTLLKELEELEDYHAAIRDARGMFPRGFHGAIAQRTSDRVPPGSQWARQFVNAALTALFDFEEQRQAERIRQARWSFNAALALIIVGTLIVLVGVVLLLNSSIRAGIVSSAAGVVSNISSAVLFKFNKDANDRLDRIKVTLAKLDSYRKTLEIIDNLSVEEPATSTNAKAE